MPSNSNLFTPAPIEVVGAVISDGKENILCALRGTSMKLPGFWEFPGGKVLEGEMPEAALMREIQEELNCTISVEKLLVVHIHDYPEITIRLSTYASRILDGNPTPTEHEDIAWVPRHRLKTLNWAPADLPTIDFLLSS